MPLPSLVKAPLKVALETLKKSPTGMPATKRPLAAISQLLATVPEMMKLVFGHRTMEVGLRLLVMPQTPS